MIVREEGAMSPVLVVIPLMVILVATLLLGEAGPPPIAAYSAIMIMSILIFVMCNFLSILIEDSREPN